MNKLLTCAIYFLFLVAFGLSCLFSFWFLYPYKSITFTKEPHKIVTPVVKAGNNVSFEFNYCKPKSIDGDLTINFIDGFIYTQPTMKSNIPAGCHMVIYQAYVPTNITPGVYSISASLNYKVNPIRNVVILTSTEKFTVIK